MSDASRGVPRIERVDPLRFSLAFAAAAFVLWSMSAAGPSLEQLARGLPNIGNILSRMFPPDLERLDRILLALFQTFQMAVAGCIIGLVLSVPLGILAAEGISPHPAVGAGGGVGVGGRGGGGPRSWA
jgi:phosphonate transport system permease protein